MRILLILVLVLGVSPGPDSFFGGTRAASGTDQERLSLVRKIYVGDMGTADEADRFRLLLEEQLLKRGFTVVDKPESADAILTGALSVRVFDNKSEARAYVRLNTPGGERIWARDFGSRLFTNPFRRVEPVKRRAEDVANGLRDDWKRASGK